MPRIRHRLDHRQIALEIARQAIDVGLQQVGIQHTDVLDALRRDVGQRHVAVATAQVEGQREEPVASLWLQWHPGVEPAV